MAFLKQGMSDWQGSDGKITSHSNLKLRFCEKSLVLVRGFLFQFGVIWEVWGSEVIIYLNNGYLKRRNVALAGQLHRNDVTQQLQTKNF